jgi:peptide/nickel transport system permease protein
VRRFIAARLAHAAVVVLLVTMIAFMLLRLAPGDPFSYNDATISPSVQARLRASFGYDKPVSEQFVKYFSNVAHGNFGYSTEQRRPAGAVIADAIPRTLTLAGASLLLSIVAGIGLGLVAAARYRRPTDRAISAISVVVYSIPDFWLALIIQMTLGLALGLFPISGLNDPTLADYGTPWQVFVDRLRHAVMPVLTLTILISVILARFQRAALIDVLSSDFLRTARAKGARERSVLVRHALRNSLTPTITMLGLIVPTVLGGIFFVEYVYDWHGLGWLSVNAVRALDYDVATGTVVISGVLVALGSLTSDVLAAVTDPRIRDG